MLIYIMKYKTITENNNIIFLFLQYKLQYRLFYKIIYFGSLVSTLYYFDLRKVLDFTMKSYIELKDIY